LTFVEIVVDFLGHEPDHATLKDMHHEIEDQLFELQMRHEGDCEFCDEFWGKSKPVMNMFFKTREK
jgi:hypothetical protein